METECAAEHAKMKEKHTCEVGWKIKPVEIIFFLKRIVLGAVRGSSLVSNMVSARQLVRLRRCHVIITNDDASIFRSAVDEINIAQKVKISYLIIISKYLSRPILPIP